jgi:hypothetical protein
LPAPGTVSTLLTSGPSGIPAAVHAPGSDSRSYPLVGFGPPTRYFPKSPPAASRPKAPLLGFRAPSAHQVAGAHVPPVARSSSPGCPGFCLLVPPSRLRRRSQVFPTSRRLLAPTALLPYFRQVALLGFCPPGVHSSHAAPTTRRRRLALVTFFPPDALALVLGEDSDGRACRSPRVSDRRH